MAREHLKARLDCGHGRRVRLGLPDRARAGAAGRARLHAAMVFACVVLLVLAACGFARGSPSGQACSPSATSAGTGRPSASSSPPSGTTGTEPAAVPAPAHTVVVVMENHAYPDIIGAPSAPFINELAHRGALFTCSHAITHPSEPNYLALFSGSTQGIADDRCPDSFAARNLAADPIKAGKSFSGYAEDLPGTGSQVCSAGGYARKHVPWTDFSNVPGSVSMPFTSFPANAFAQLPAVSFVIHNLCDDMHDCDVAAGDAWLRARIGGYADWAMTHDSLLILTWDEDDGSQGNHITTLFVGQMVRLGSYAEPITHYSVLATIEAAYGLPRDGQAAATTPITDVWLP